MGAKNIEVLVSMRKFMRTKREKKRTGAPSIYYVKFLLKETFYCFNTYSLTKILRMCNYNKVSQVLINLLTLAQKRILNTRESKC